MPNEPTPGTVDVALLQLLPEEEPAGPAGHLHASCRVTCPLFTSDSVPSVCRAD